MEMIEYEAVQECLFNKESFFVTTIAEFQRDFIRLGFQRPEKIPVQQEEVYRRIREEELPGPPVELPEQWQRLGQF